MSELVQVENNNAFTTSLIIGEEFGVAHNEVLKKIRSFTGEILPVSFNNMYKPFNYVNDRGREYPAYKINRDGYMFLVMNIGTKKANSKKLMFIEAFNKMEKYILNNSNNEWLTAREQTKEVRRIETDTIKEFVEYAKSQGSGSPKWYFKHYTNATYKALGLLSSKVPKTRDTLDLLELNHLIVAEDIISKIIKSEMEKETHYKVIFERCKIALDNFAKAILIGSSNYNKLLKIEN